MSDHEKTDLPDKQDECPSRGTDFKNVLLEMPDVGDDSIFKRIREFPKPVVCWIDQRSGSVPVMRRKASM